MAATQATSERPASPGFGGPSPPPMFGLSGEPAPLAPPVASPRRSAPAAGLRGGGRRTPSQTSLLGRVQQRRSALSLKPVLSESPATCAVAPRGRTLASERPTPGAARPVTRAYLAALSSNAHTASMPSIRAPSAGRRSPGSFHGPTLAKSASQPLRTPAAGQALQRPPGSRALAPPNALSAALRRDSSVHEVLTDEEDDASAGSSFLSPREQACLADSDDRPLSAVGSNPHFRPPSLNLQPLTSSGSARRTLTSPPLPLAGRIESLWKDSPPDVGRRPPSQEPLDSCRLSSRSQATASTAASPVAIQRTLVHAQSMGSLPAASSVHPTPPVEDSFVRVVARVRPQLPSEADSPDGVEVLPDGQTIVIKDRSGSRRKMFGVDQAFDSRRLEQSSQSTFFDAVGQNMVCTSLLGFNICVFAYGHTGTGKTHTMFGGGPGMLPSLRDDSAGMLPRFLQSLDAELRFTAQDVAYSCQYLEVYSDEVRDLLAKPVQLSPGRQDARPKLQVRVKPTGVAVDGVEPTAASTSMDVVELLEKGNARRVTSSTTLNQRSSRSHAVFTLRYSQQGHGTQTVTFVDLAGREDQTVSKNRAQTFKEMIAINTSLFHLAHVITKLSEGSAVRGSRADFRNSKLTLLLSEAFVGNSKTLLVATLSPAASFYDDSLPTLSFAQSVKNIQTPAMLQARKGQAMVMEELAAEVLQLRGQLHRATEAESLNAALHAEISELQRQMEERQTEQDMQRDVVLQELQEEVEALRAGEQDCISANDFRQRAEEMEDENVRLRQELAQVHELQEEVEALRARDQDDIFADEFRQRAEEIEDEHVRLRQELAQARELQEEVETLRAREHDDILADEFRQRAEEIEDQNLRLREELVQAQELQDKTETLRGTEQDGILADEFRQRVEDVEDENLRLREELAQAQELQEEVKSLRATEHDGIVPDDIRQRAEEVEDENLRLRKELLQAQGLHSENDKLRVELEQLQGKAAGRSGVTRTLLCFDSTSKQGRSNRCDCGKAQGLLFGYVGAGWFRRRHQDSCPVARKGKELKEDGKPTLPLENEDVERGTQNSF